MEGTQLSLSVGRKRSKMADGACVYPALTWLPEVQEMTPMDTGFPLEHRGGLDLGLIKGTERLCLLCPGCRRLTALVSAWIQCGHCEELLTKLTQSEKELLTYSLDL